MSEAPAKKPARRAPAKKAAAPAAPIAQSAATGRLVKGGSVDIRGNTDESWDRGLKFLLEEHVFDDRR